MSKGAADRWARAPWYCEVCHHVVAQGHRSRHKKTASHIRLELAGAGQHARYEVKPSDVDFAIFIARIDASFFLGLEQEIYLKQIRPELETIFKENDGQLVRESEPRPDDTRSYLRSVA